MLPKMEKNGGFTYTMGRAHMDTLTHTVCSKQLWAACRQPVLVNAATKSKDWLTGLYYICFLGLDILQLPKL